MATVYNYLQSANNFYSDLQVTTDLAEARRHKRFQAVLLLQRMTRGYLIRKHVAWLSKNATIIQCAFRVHLARKAYREALKRAVKNKHNKYYAKASRRIQALWRGHFSRRIKFNYRAYRRWLAIVREKGERKAAEAFEFGVRSRADDLYILEEEARQWLAFVVFKLHHLLRTFVCAGIYSNLESPELTEFEKLLIAIRYTDYMRRLKRKYNEFVKKHKTGFSNKRLFPVIGDGADYWYLSLPEMYELTKPVPKKKTEGRHVDTHHGSMHKKPFLWKKVRPPGFMSDRGPYTPPRLPPPSPTPPPTPDLTGDAKPMKDPRFHLYVKHYKPRPDVLNYVNFHINVLLKRKCSIQNIGA